jgi:hypothetical protein
MSARRWLPIALLLVPGAASASCESGFKVESAAISFAHSETFPSPGEPAAIHAHFRSLAHAIAVAQCCFDTAHALSCEAGTPPRARIGSTPDGGLEVADVDDALARNVVDRCSHTVVDSTCVLWTVEIGRFRTEKGARTLADGVSIASDPEVLKGGWIRSRDATILYASCGGSWEPWSFVVHLSGGVAPWATRTGLFLTREDAEREAARWYDAFGRPPRIVRQRVDGALLEQALRQPVEGC